MDFFKFSVYSWPSFVKVKARFGQVGDWVGLGLAKLLTKSAKSRTRLVKVRARTIMRFFFDYCQDPGPGPGPNLVLTWLGSLVPLLVKTGLGVDI